MKKSNWRTLLVIFLVLGGVGYLIFSGVSETGVYYRTVSEVLDQLKAKDSGPIRVSGEVVDNTIDYNQTDMLLSFAIRDPKDSSKTIRAVYKGVAPDAFKADIEVVLEGKYDRANNTLHATMLLAKCPSKYVAEDSSL
ncbi:MAG TPA: cytochrome c maturation protein CcmE [Proteobacteria bacterium]|nr:cytochrome c-type biogenesis protein CcmE [bacterium BMS3Abin14]HDL54099.1 cytochrome c maturation protein CcmE [Pseudomonadota bacterium]